MSDNGRDNTGRFAAGNKFSKGNAHNKRVAEWRSVLNEVVTPDRLKGIVIKLVTAALQGEPWAIKEVLVRCLGTPISGDVEARLDALEEMICERQ